MYMNSEHYIYFYVCFLVVDILFLCYQNLPNRFWHITYCSGESSGPKPMYLDPMPLIYLVDLFNILLQEGCTVKSSFLILCPAGKGTSATV